MRHFPENQRKFIEQMLTLGIKYQKTENKSLRSKLATDLSQWCDAEYETALTKCIGDPRTIRRL